MLTQALLKTIDTESAVSLHRRLSCFVNSVMDISVQNFNVANRLI